MTGNSTKASKLRSTSKRVKILLLIYDLSHCLYYCPDLFILGVCTLFYIAIGALMQESMASISKLRDTLYHTRLSPSVRVHTQNP